MLILIGIIFGLNALDIADINIFFDSLWISFLYTYVANIIIGNIAKKAHVLDENKKFLKSLVKKYDLKKYFKQTLETLRGIDAAPLFENYIRVDSAVEWAQDNSKPVVAYKKNSRSAVEYIKLAKEITDHVNRKERD